MLFTKKNLALSLALLMLLSLSAIGLHQRHHMHRHGLSRRGCPVCAALNQTRSACTSRIDIVIAADNKSGPAILPTTEFSVSSRYKRIFSIRPPPA